MLTAEEEIQNNKQKFAQEEKEKVFEGLFPYLSNSPQKPQASRLADRIKRQHQILAVAA